MLGAQGRIRALPPARATSCHLPNVLPPESALAVFTGIRLGFLVTLCKPKASTLTRMTTFPLPDIELKLSTGLLPALSGKGTFSLVPSGCRPGCFMTTSGVAAVRRDHRAAGVLPDQDRTRILAAHGERIIALAAQAAADRPARNDTSAPADYELGAGSADKTRLLCWAAASGGQGTVVLRAGRCLGPRATLDASTGADRARDRRRSPCVPRVMDYSHQLSLRQRSDRRLCSTLALASGTLTHGSGGAVALHFRSGPSQAMGFLLGVDPCQR